jgi:hypothetical protein
MVNFPGYKVAVTKVAPGFFYVSDFFGGYYDQKAAYGATYAMTGYVKLNPDNTIGVVSSSIKGWGDSLTGLAGGVYNPTEKSLYWEAGYSITNPMIFYVKLNKK